MKELAKGEIKECPCCGGKSKRIDNCIQGVNLWQIRCADCGIQTYWADVMDWGDNLYSLWNKRINTPPPIPEQE